MIWFSSDFHYWHKNLTYGETVWSDKEHTTRKFDTTKEMSRALVESINKYVQQDDEIYFLGDFAFSGIENIWNFRKQIICENIYFICGNHDQHIKKNKVLPNCVTSSIGQILELKESSKHIRLSNAQDLFNMLPDLTTITIDKQKFVLSHYPLEQWEEMDKGSIMLHGHCHHNLDKNEINMKYRRMDVGIDWKEFRPYSLEEILMIMEKREFKKHVKK